MKEFDKILSKNCALTDVLGILEIQNKYVMNISTWKNKIKKRTVLNDKLYDTD